MILSGFESHIKLKKISLFILLIICTGGLSRTVSGYMSFGRAKVITTVTFPINDSFLCFHRFKQLTKSLSFGSKLFSINLSFSLENIIPNVFADSEVHSNRRFSK